MTMLTTSKLKLKPFYMRFVYFMNWCCTSKFVYFLFQNYLQGSREGQIAYGKHGRLMKLIGDQVQVFLMSSTKPHVTFGLRKERVKSNTLTIPTTELSQLVIVTTASCGIRLGCSGSLWKAYQVYF
jgi:hypothetical protein